MDFDIDVETDKISAVGSFEEDIYGVQAQRRKSTRLSLVVPCLPFSNSPFIEYSRCNLSGQLSRILTKSPFPLVDDESTTPICTQSNIDAGRDIVSRIDTQSNCSPVNHATFEDQRKTGSQDERSESAPMNGFLASIISCKTPINGGSHSCTIADSQKINPRDSSSLQPLPDDYVEGLYAKYIHEIQSWEDLLSSMERDYKCLPKFVMSNKDAVLDNEVLSPFVDILFPEQSSGKSENSLNFRTRIQKSYFSILCSLQSVVEYQKSYTVFFDQLSKHIAKKYSYHYKHSPQCDLNFQHLSLDEFWKLLSCIPPE